MARMQNYDSECSKSHIYSLSDITNWSSPRITIQRGVFYIVHTKSKNTANFQPRIGNRMLTFNPLQVSKLPAHQLQAVNQKPSHPWKTPYLQVYGVVVEPIFPGKIGRIRIHGIYWPAQTATPLNWTIPAGTGIKTIGRFAGTLLIEPACTRVTVVQAP